MIIGIILFYIALWKRCAFFGLELDFVALVASWIKNVVPVLCLLLLLL
jgi:hypothetical protein